VNKGSYTLLLVLVLLFSNVTKAIIIVLRNKSDQEINYKFIPKDFVKRFEEIVGNGCLELFLLICPKLVLKEKKVITDLDIKRYAFLLAVNDCSHKLIDLEEWHKKKVEKRKNPFDKLNITFK